MSLGSEFLVNTTTRNAQFDSDNASSANGMSVTVWTDTFSSTDHDIRAQRYNRFGGRQGPEIVVSNSARDEGSPSVAMDANGNFVVTWTQTQLGGDTNVLAQRFNSAGSRLGGNISVGVGTFREHDPDVARDAVGNFVVSYTRDTNNTNPDIFAKQYNSSGLLLRVISVATSSKAEDRSSIAMRPDGRFDVAYQLRFSSTDDDILLNRYSASGGLLGPSAVANSTAREQAPSVSMDNFGNAVVAYQKFVGSDFDIKARRVSSIGTLGSEINIQSTSAQETNPTVALKRGGGGFVVAYNSSSRVKVSEVSSSNTVLASRDAGSSRFGPALSIDGNNSYMLTDTAIDLGNLNIRGRFGHLA